MFRIKLFIYPIYDKILKDDEFFGVWDNVNKEWGNYKL